MKFGRLFLASVSLLIVAQPAYSQEFGWAGEDVAKAARQQLAQQLPPFELKGAGAPNWQGKTLSLWKFTTWVNKGKHLENVAQETGDCVSFGYGHACEYSMAVNIALGAKAEMHRTFKPYIYGASRVWIGGGRLRGAGSTGAWASAGIKQEGALSSDEPGVPAYSGSVANRWGLPPGPPAEFRTIARKSLADARFVRTWDECCEAIANGMPVPICSSAGFSMREVDGRLYGVWNKTWPHCMCLIGYDDRPGKEACYCLNSWGPTTHASMSYYNRTGEPPGGFWIRKADVERILRQGDSYAVSFNGFGRRNLFGWKGGDCESLFGSSDAGVGGGAVDGLHAGSSLPGTAVAFRPFDLDPWPRLVFVRPEPCPILRALDAFDSKPFRLEPTVVAAVRSCDERAACRVADCRAQSADHRVPRRRRDRQLRGGPSAGVVRAQAVGGLRRSVGRRSPRDGRAEPGCSGLCSLPRRGI